MLNFLPETCLADVKRMEPIDGMSRISKVGFHYLLLFIYLSFAFVFLSFLAMNIFVSFSFFTKLLVSMISSLVQNQYRCNSVCFPFNSVSEQDRWRLLCSICGVSYGACIQVSHLSFKLNSSLSWPFLGQLAGNS